MDPITGAWTTFRNYLAKKRKLKESAELDEEVDDIMQRYCKQVQDRKHGYSGESQTSGKGKHVRNYSTHKKPSGMTKKEFTKFFINEYLVNTNHDPLEILADRNKFVKIAIDVFNFLEPKKKA
jgi:hypothetical protein